MDLASIEKKIKALVDKCQMLEKRNSHLEKRCRDLEKAKDLVASKAKRILKHIKSMHKDGA